MYMMEMNEWMDPPTFAILSIHYGNVLGRLLTSNSERSFQVNNLHTRQKRYHHNYYYYPSYPTEARWQNFPLFARAKAWARGTSIDNLDNYYDDNGIVSISIRFSKCWSTNPQCIYLSTSESAHIIFSLNFTGASQWIFSVKHTMTVSQ